MQGVKYSKPVQGDERSAMLGGGGDKSGGGSSKGSSGNASCDISTASGQASNDSEIEMLNQG